jgi:hypothetical protein
MRPNRSIGMLLTGLLVAFGVVLSVPGVAAADNLGGIITADMNNDGIPDQVQLGQVGGLLSTTCTVTVSLGKSDGTFGTPKVHTYTSAEKQGPFCPDQGVAMKLGNEKKPDLVTSMSFGFNDLIVLHNFQPTAIFTTGVIQPTWLRTADLNGDGRQDLIEWSDQESDVATLINTPQRTLVRGPFNVVTLRSGGTGAFGPQYVLADFNGDGGQDMLISVNNQSSFTAPISAEVFFGNGQAPVVLASTGDFRAVWTVFSIDINFDGIPDAGVIEKSGTGVTTIQYFRNDGAGHFTLAATS